MGKGLEELEVLTEAQRLADEVWSHVVTWEGLARDVVGVQFARAADSVGANIAEAFGRYHFADKLRFLYYARGSLFEARYWLGRAKARALLTGQEGETLDHGLEQLGRRLNAFIRSLKAQSRSLREPFGALYSPEAAQAAADILQDEDTET